ARMRATCSASSGEAMQTVCVGMGAILCIAASGAIGGISMNSTRPTISGPRHAVSAGHYLAAAAGFAILEAGGNAVDAGCAAGIALGVTQPDLVNFAGVAPIMIRMADGTLEPIAGLGHWPRAMPPDAFMRDGKIPDG